MTSLPLITSTAPYVPFVASRSSPSATIESEAATIPPSATVTIGSGEAQAPTYARPVAPTLVRVLASPSRDDIAQLMERNVKVVSGAPADVWRGLGSALLARFKTTQTDYTQTVVDHTAALSDKEAFSAIESGPLSANLVIRTRSGQTVQILITASNGIDARGLHVEVRNSGELNAAETDALAALADGFEQALQGLGRADKPVLDVSGLLDYDTAVLAGVDLTVGSTRPTDAVQSFELHANESRRAISLSSTTGALSIDVDLTTPLGTGGPAQQKQAMDSYLAQFDAATRRGHGNDQLLALFKNAFAQMHAPAAQPMALLNAPTDNDIVDAQARALLTGLNDFDASFGGDFTRNDSRGSLSEKENSHFQVEQETTLQRIDATGNASIAQTQRSQLDALYERGQGDASLSVGLMFGNYDIYTMKDTAESSTTISAAKGRITSAVQHQAMQQNLGYQRVENGRVVDTKSTPESKSLLRSLV